MKYKFKNLAEFRKAHLSEYVNLYNKGLLEQLCNDMGWERHSYKGVWLIKENVLKEAFKFDSISEWANKSKNSIVSARENKWMEECTAHMKRPKIYWNKEKCINEALKHQNISNWVKQSKVSVNYAKKNGWFDECIEHMESGQKPSGYWTKEKCLEEALKFNSKYEWRKGSKSSLSAATKNGWVNELSRHMLNLQNQKPTGYWTKERCIENALKYNKLSEWKQNNRGSASAAKKYGWLDECTKHMIIRKTKPSKFWKVKENCLAEARKYSNRTEFSINSQSCYTSSKKHGWFDECTEHMGKMRSLWFKNKNN